MIFACCVPLIYYIGFCFLFFYVFFFQAEDGIRDLVRSRGLGDVYKRQPFGPKNPNTSPRFISKLTFSTPRKSPYDFVKFCICLLYTSDAADERSSVDLGGRRIIKKKTKYRYF